MATFNFLTFWGFGTLSVLLLCLSCPNVATARIAVLDQRQSCPPGITPGSCVVSSANCDFYSCLDAEHNCGPDGYPLGYGLKYCQAFIDDAYKFSSEGQIWLANVRPCLQQALVPDDNCQTSCSQIESDAFGSHAACYVDNGLCELPPSDWIALAEVVGLPTLQLIGPELINLLQVTEGCFAAWSYLSSIL
jgi:hypothetical protein